MTRLFPAARQAVESNDGPEVWELDIEETREADRKEAALEPKEEVAEARDIDADGVPCRLYVPADAQDGLIVHLHGGGFVFNDVEVHDAAVRRFANRTRMRVLSVDYRRPPEHPFPAAPDDVDTVIGWLRSNELGDQRLYAHGDSAGGNLALVAALRNPGTFAALVLVYPFTDPSMSTYEPEDDWGRDAAWYWDQYAGDADRTDPDLGPWHATDEALQTLPPTLVISAEGDILTEENEALAHRIADLGVEVVAFRALGEIHGFWRRGTVFPAAEPVMAMTAGFLAGR